MGQKSKNAEKTKIKWKSRKILKESKNVEKAEEYCKSRKILNVSKKVEKAEKSHVYPTAKPLAKIFTQQKKEKS